jgi:hypothetical protein
MILDVRDRISFQAQIFAISEVNAIEYNEDYAVYRTQNVLDELKKENGYEEDLQIIEKIIEDEIEYIAI